MPSPRRLRPGKVREPIQVYLDRGERATLDRLARELDVSRAEVLRRGLGLLREQRRETVYEWLDRLARTPVETPPPPEPGSVEAFLLEEHDRKEEEYRRKYS